MARSLDALIKFLLDEIALCGEQGTAVSTVLKLIDQYYNTFEGSAARDTTLNAGHGEIGPVIDKPFQEFVWFWLAKHRDVSVGKNKEWNHLSLGELEAKATEEEEEIAAASIDESVSAIVGNADSVAAPTTPQIVNVTHVSVVAKPRSLTSQETSANTKKVRIFVSKQRIWLAITGHGPDVKRIAPMEFALLQIIAYQHEKGILQPELTKLSGQDKRSTPRRLDFLHKKGYIEKKRVQVRGMITSLCTLKKFANNKEIHSDKSSGIIDLKSWIKEMFDILREPKLLTLDDIKYKMGLNNLRWQTRIFAKLIRRMETAGCLKRVRAASQYSQHHHRNYHKCVQLLREPTQREIDHIFYRMGQLDSIKDDVESGDEDAEKDSNSRSCDVSSNKMKLSSIKKPSPEWIPNEDLPNIIQNVVSRAGVKGISSMDLKAQTVGNFFHRPFEQLCGRLTDLWQLSQPSHIRHCAIIRDTALKNKVAHYVYYTYESYEERVKQGRSYWEAVTLGPKELEKRIQGTSLTTDEVPLDDYGFPTFKRPAQLEDGSKTIAECIAASKIAPFRRTRYDAIRVARPDGSLTVLYDKSSLSQFHKATHSIYVPGSHWSERRKRKRTSKLAEFEEPSAEPTLEGDAAPLAKKPRLTRKKGPQLQRSTTNVPRSIQASPTLMETTESKQAVGPLRPAIPALTPGKLPPMRTVKLPRAAFMPNSKTTINHKWLEEEKAFINRFKPGVYIAPRAWRDPSRITRGRPKKSQIVVFQIPRLRDFKWFKPFTPPPPRNAVQNVLSAPTPPKRRNSDVENNQLQIQGSVLGSAQGSEPTRSQQYRQIQFEETRPAKKTKMSGEALQSQNNVQSTEPLPLPKDASTNGTRSTVVSEKLNGPELNNEIEIIDETEEVELEQPKPGTINETVSLDNAQSDVEDLPPLLEESFYVEGIPKTAPVNPRGKIKLKGPVGGSIAMERKAIITDIMKSCNGVFPGDTEMWYPFVTAWQKHGHSGRPDLRTVKASIKNLIDAGKLRQLKFSCKDKKGVMVIKNMFTWTEIPTTSPVVRKMQRNIIESLPHIYIPPEVYVDPDLKRSRVLEGLNLKEQKEARNFDITNEEVKLSYVPAYAKHARLSREKNLESILSRTIARRERDYRVKQKKAARELRLQALCAKAAHDQNVQSASMENFRCVNFELSDTVDQLPCRVSRLRRINRPSPLRPYFDSASDHSYGPKVAEKSTYYLPYAENEIDNALFQTDPSYKRSLLASESSLDTFPAAVQSSRSVPGQAQSDDGVENIRASIWPYKRHALERRRQELACSDQLSTEARFLMWNNEGGYEMLDSDGQPSNDWIESHYKTKIIPTLTAPSQTFYPNTGIFSTNFASNHIIPINRDDDSSDEPSDNDLCELIDSKNVFSNNLISEKLALELSKLFSREDFDMFGKPTSINDIFKFEPHLNPDRGKPQDPEDALLNFTKELEAVEDYELKVWLLSDDNDAVFCDWNFINHEFPAAHHETVEDEFYQPIFDLRCCLVPALDASTLTKKSSFHVIPLARMYPGISSQTISVTTTRRKATTELTRIRAYHPRQLKSSLPDKLQVRRISGLADRENDMKLTTKACTRKRRRNWASTQPVLVQRVIISVIAVRTITGGLERNTDWSLIETLFEPEYDLRTIHNMWRRLVQTSSARIDQAQEEFEELFLEAYEKGDVPPFDFNNIEDYDWRTMINWAVEHIDQPRELHVPELPETQGEFNAKFKIERMRTNRPSNMDLFLLVDSGESVASRSRRIASIPFCVPLPERKNDSGLVDAQKEEDLLLTARTWVRANVLSAEESYEPNEAAEKLHSLGERRVEKALTYYINHKSFSQANRGRLVPGRNYDVSEFFLRQMTKSVEERQFRRACDFKRALDVELHEHGLAKLMYQAEDGDIIALLNLLANKRIVIEAENEPHDKWGLIRNVYITRNMPKKFLIFDMIIRPTQHYIYGSPLQSTYPAIPTPHRSDAHGKLPVWFDIHGNFIPVMWNMALAAVLSSLAMRPGVDCEALADMMKPSMDKWEVEVLVKWICQAGGATEIQRPNEHATYEMNEWWWLLLPT